MVINLTVCCIKSSHFVSWTLCCIRASSHPANLSPLQLERTALFPFTFIPWYSSIHPPILFILFLYCLCVMTHHSKCPSPLPYNLLFLHPLILLFLPLPCLIIHVTYDSSLTLYFYFQLSFLSIQCAFSTTLGYIYPSFTFVFSSPSCLQAFSPLLQNTVLSKIIPSLFLQKNTSVCHTSQSFSIIYFSPITSPPILLETDKKNISKSKSIDDVTLCRVQWRISRITLTKVLINAS